MSVIPSRAKALSLRISIIGRGLGVNRPSAVSRIKARSRMSSSSVKEAHDDLGSE
jgi:hypothetical protein